MTTQDFAGLMLFLADCNEAEIMPSQDALIAGDLIGLNELDNEQEIWLAQLMKADDDRLIHEGSRGLDDYFIDGDNAGRF